MRLVLGLTMAIVAALATMNSSIAAADDDEFPAFARPTNFDLSPIERTRIGAVDQLRATGHQGTAAKVQSKTRPGLPFFTDMLGTSDVDLYKQQLSFLGPSGKRIRLKPRD